MSIQIDTFVDISYVLHVHPFSKFTPRRRRHVLNWIDGLLGSEVYRTDGGAQGGLAPSTDDAPRGVDHQWKGSRL